MSFIKVTDLHGRSVVLNTSRIESVTAINERACVSLVNEGDYARSFKIKESLEQIIVMLGLPLPSDQTSTAL